MNIVLVAHSNAPWTPHYATFLQRSGHTVHVISFHPDPVPGVSRIFVGREPFDEDRDKHLFYVRIPMVRRILRELNPDIVFSPYLVSNGLTTALSWGGPFVVSARGGDVLERSDNRAVPRSIRKRIIAYVCRRAGRVHAVSEELVEALEDCGVSHGKIRCFPVGVDVHRFSLTGETVSPGHTPHIICTRRHESVYQNHVVVEALALLLAAGRAFRCTFVGGGRLLEQRRLQVRDLGLDPFVAFTSQVEHSRMPALLRSADIYVSAAYSDGTSSSLLESLACGLFPVLTDIRANRDWIRHEETGLLFDAGNAQECATVLARAMDDARLRARARDVNRKAVEARGNQEVNNVRLMRLLEEVAESAAVISR